MTSPTQASPARTPERIAAPRASAATEAASYWRSSLRAVGRNRALGQWHDAETGLFGPRAWARILAAEAARHRRHGGVATVVVVEMPAPEDAAAARGPGAHRRAHGRIASVLTSMARTSDHVARIGSRRFAILLPETDEVAAVNFVERVRPCCDEALRSADPSDRCRFGWADAHESRSLDEAVEVAVSRLASDP